MVTVRWIGKNGRDVQSASDLLTKSVSEYGGKHVLPWPAEGHVQGNSFFTTGNVIGSSPEEPIPPSEADYTFLFDENLISKGPVPVEGTGVLIVNTPILGYHYGKNRRILPINAAELSMSVTGGGLIASSFLGVFAALSGTLPFEAGVNGIKKHFGGNSERQISLYAVTYGIVLEGSSL
jgi:hypothetical protein